ncbi:NAD(P)-binding protein [Corynespora cassiicola Philippines]|uniref:NAD(P)-binding protein n=1 Tax=Corynespora cassiicola Philippines TaxID=1448308 RepID=A0A2T2N1X8_CORCC|nr:NAD(P)-binding protein [Corynespora cassiicola Philippines]
MINFGIIGTNWITHSYVESAQSTNEWKLVAVYSRADATAKEFASKYDQPVSTYTSLDALAADANVQAVYIASPNSFHHAHAKHMLLAGKHVVLEKPSTSTSAELDELFAIAKDKKLFLIEAFRHIQEKNFKVLKDRIAGLGTIFGASITYAQYSSRYEKVLAGETPNIFNLDFSAGALTDLGVYCVCAAVELFGKPKRSTYYPVIIRTGADGGGRLVLEYDGFVVHLCHSKIYNSDAPSEVYGEKGTLIVPTITDIESVVLWDPRAKTRTELKVGEAEKLNLREEAVEHARVINEADWKAFERYERLSRDVLEVMETVRRDNGLLFKVEREGN